MAESVKKKNAPKSTKSTTKKGQKTAAAPSSKGNSYGGGVKRQQTRRTANKKQLAKAKQTHQPVSEGEVWDFPMGKEIVLLTSIGLCVLLFTSCFVSSTNALYWLRQIQMGLFGNIAYVAPIVFIIQIIWVYCVGWGLKNEIKIAGELLLLMSLCSLCQLYARVGFQTDQSVLYYFVIGQDGGGGGLMGAILLVFFYPPLGTTGCTIVLILILLVAFMLISEKSVVQCTKKVGEILLWLALKSAEKGKDFVAACEKRYQSYRNEKRERRKLERAQQELDEQKQSAGLFEGIKEKWDFLFKDDWDDWDDADEDDSQEGVKEEAFEWDDSAVEIYPKEEKAVLQAQAAMTKQQSEREEAKGKGVKKQKVGREVLQEEVPEEGSLQEKTLDEDVKEKTPKERVSRMAQIKNNSWSRQQQGADSSGLDEEEYRIVERANGTTRIVLRNALPGEEVVPPAKKKKQEENTVPKRLAPNIVYQLPSTDLLSQEKSSRRTLEFENEVQRTAKKLQQVFDSFGVNVTINSVSCGPAVTRYELQPAQGVKVSRIVSLADDIKLNLAAADIRIEAPIPGKAAVGIEVPNKENSLVPLRGLLEDKAFVRHPSKLAFAVGKDLGGANLVADIAKMPHLLIAGATGSGKSVCINTLLISILYRAKPDEVRMIMIDPKVVELSVYNGIPHLMLPVVTDPKMASNALGWAVAEMTRRYQAFAQYGVRDIRGYNRKVMAGEIVEKDGIPAKMPQILIVVDELADLMMVAPNDVEDAICRLAQLARAAGIHLVIATQRPSVNVITGIIKANIPSRIAFSVSSGVDSRTILDMNGAEKLLGRGDMLFYPSGYPKPVRVQGAFVSDDEVKRVVDFWIAQNEEQESTGEQNEQLTLSLEDLEQDDTFVPQRDELFEQAGRTIIEKGKASIGMLQRLFQIGFNRAARIMDQLHEAGVVGEEEGTKPRKILMDIPQFEELLEAGKNSEKSKG